MYSAGGNAVLPALGFPIRESADQWLFSASPRLFAAVHALLRLLVPRHPPCALLILTVIRHSRTRRSSKRPVIPVWLTAIVATAASWHGCAVFKVREEAPSRTNGPPTTGPAGSRPVSQNSTACTRPPDHEGRARRAKAAGGCQVRSTFRKPIQLGRRVDATGSPSSAAPFLELPRKEVIQPHLPVRLPCYDFTPVTSPTFDGSLPEG